MDWIKWPWNCLEFNCTPWHFFEQPNCSNWLLLICKTSSSLSSFFQPFLSNLLLTTASHREWEHTTQRNYESAQVVAIFCYIIFHSNLLQAHKSKNIKKTLFYKKCTFSKIRIASKFPSRVLLRRETTKERKRVKKKRKQIKEKLILSNEMFWCCFRPPLFPKNLNKIFSFWFQKVGLILIQTEEEKI